MRNLSAIQNGFYAHRNHNLFSEAEVNTKYACPVEGKIALIVGGARGIGEGIARDFVKNGAQVAIADVAQDNAK